MDETPVSNDLFLFLASTAHDMKNSISVLSGTIETLLAGASPQAAPACPQMAQMLYQTRRLNDSLMQLLALYKRVGQPEYPFDLQPVEVAQLAAQVQSVHRILLDAKGIVLSVEVDPALVWHVDEDLVIGVLGHAINNAIHYTAGRIRLVLASVGGCLEIRVEDDGAGYPAALLAAGISAMRGQRRGVDFLANRTGLGLFFASEVAKMHKHRGQGGSLRLENGGAWGGGCFILRLP